MPRPGTDSSYLVRLNGDPLRLSGIALRAGGAVGLTVRSLGARGYVLEGSSDLQAWLPLHTNSAAGLDLEFKDAEATKFSRRFYRARLLSN